MGGNANLLMIAIILIIFYFFMIRPQTKKQKELKKFREGLGPGDKIVTIGGVHGKILEVTDTTFLLGTESGKIRIDKTAVASSTEDRLGQVN